MNPLNYLYYLKQVITKGISKVKSNRTLKKGFKDHLDHPVNPFGCSESLDQSKS